MPFKRCCWIATLCLAAAVRAEDASQEPASKEPEVIAEPQVQIKPEPVGRTWLFNDEARVPAPMQALAYSRLTYSAGSSPTRPFATNLGNPGAMLELGGEIGLFRGVSIQFTGAQGEVQNSSSSGTGAQVGLRWAALQQRTTRLVVSAGYLHELTGGDGAWSNLMFEQDIGRVRMALSVLGEHVFGQGRDGIDVMVRAGVDTALVGPLRLGFEYVGQDLEEIEGEEAEGGARHIVAGVIGVRFLSERLSIVGGPAVNLAAEGNRILGRLAIAYTF